MSRSRRSSSYKPERKSRTRNEARLRRRKRRLAQEALREREIAEGLERATNPSASNRTSDYASIEEEKAERESIVCRFLDSIRTQMPELMKSLENIRDFRNPKKIKHQLSMVLFYGILCFVMQISSRREANRDLTGPVLLMHLRQHFPDLKKLPHQDTLNRILSGIDVEAIQNTHLEMIKRLIRNKKFIRLFVESGEATLGELGNA